MKCSILLPGILRNVKACFRMLGFSVMAGWQCWLHWADPRLTSGCLSSLCKNAVLCPPAWRPPVLAPWRPAPAQSCPPRSALGSPSRRPSVCACRRPEPGGNSEPAPPAKTSDRVQRIWHQLKYSVFFMYFKMSSTTKLKLEVLLSLHFTNLL